MRSATAVAAGKAASTYRKGRSHAAWHDPGRMNAFLREGLNQLQAKLAQFDAIAGHFRMLGNYTQDITRGRIRIHAEEEIRSGQIEETQCVGLDNLGVMRKFAQFPRGGGHAHTHYRVTSFSKKPAGG